MRIQETYEELLERELEELKASAAAATGYRKTVRVEEACQEALEWIRPQIKKGHDEIRRLREIIARHERNAIRWNLELDSYWVGALARKEATLAAEQRYRDEIKEGLRMSKKVRREQDREVSKILREFDRERKKRLKSKSRSTEELD